MSKQRLDIKQHVTDMVIAQIEAGTPPWRKPWTGGGMAIPLRHNGQPYKGINVLILWIAAQAGAYTSPRWMTFKQAKELGGMVRKGQKSTKIIYYGSYEREIDGAQNGETETVTSRFAKSFSVFNCDQIDGLPEEYYTPAEPPKSLGTEAIPELDEFFAATGAQIVTSGRPAAFYRPSTDEIHMPPIETFHSSEAFYSTLAHESVHWSGATHRLDRLRSNGKKTEYAFEELVAELGSCFIAVDRGFDPQFDQSAAYIESWLKALKNDSGFIFKAAAEAQKAFDYIIGLTGHAHMNEAA